MYKPKDCVTLAETKSIPQIRLGEQGFPGTGKTWGALTFPNPVVLNLDRGLGAHIGRGDIIEVPLWNPDFCRKINPRFTPSDLKDVVAEWIDKEGSKLEFEQTLVVDGNTSLQNAYHKWWEANKMSSAFVTKGGDVDSFKEWSVKKQFYGQIFEALKTLRCHVIFICHEVDLKDKNGVAGPVYSGKIRPLLTGAFGDEIGSHMTDWFRAHSAAKLSADDIKKNAESLKLKWGMSEQDFKLFQDSIHGNTIYYWQTQGDSVFDAKASSLAQPFPLYIPADFKSFEKYRRKISQ